MPDFDVGFKIVARAAGPRLAEMGGVVCQEWDPIGGEVQTTERLADRAFRVLSGSERLIVYMEAYTRWQASAPWSVLAKSGLLSERERLPTRSLVYILLPQGYQAQRGRLHLKAAGVTTQHVRFREIRMWRQQPQPSWEDSPGLMALTPLCRQRRSPVATVTHAASAILARETDIVMRASLLTALGLFGKLVYRDISPFAVIGREHMRESPFYDEIMEEGRIETGRADLLEIVEVRFGAKAAAEFKEAVNRIERPDVLRRLHRLAIQARRLADFRKDFAETTAP